MSWTNWVSCDDERAERILSRLKRQAPAVFTSASLVESEVTELPWYRASQLIRLEFARPSVVDQAFVLDDGETTRWLNGESGPIYFTNDAEQFKSTDETVLDYLRFFCYFLRADEGGFVLIEDPLEIEIDPGAVSRSADFSTDEAGEESSEVESDLDVNARLALVRSRVTPLTIRPSDDPGTWLIDTSIAYGGSFFTAKISVASDGYVQMVDDDPVSSLEGLSVPQYPLLSVPGDALLLLNRPVTELFVSVLLEDAIGKLKQSRQGQMYQKTADTPLEWFQRVVLSSRPNITIIESDIPFAEEIVAGLLDGPGRVISGGEIYRASAVQGDELRCEVTRDASGATVHLLSLHVYNDVFACERVSHEFGRGKAIVFIGCDFERAVPEPLRRIRDFTLSLGRHLDAETFARIFARVLGSPPPVGWEVSGTEWTSAILPSDFEKVKHFSEEVTEEDDTEIWSPEQCVDHLRQRAQERIRSLSAEAGPRLDELHGLGEARLVCEDLVADIRAANAEPRRLSWKAVDPGLLLVGAPGTGKTSLALAVAKESGVRFVKASAASWQSAGALDAHLRAMRADFALARRFAPAILFIDEIDSVGSRDHLEGPNAVYQTDVINALLEQMQGVDESNPVLVIGATNYPDKVDPALRRAGRLDQVVHVPPPNVAGLERIFEQELKTYRDENQVAPDVDSRRLGELTLGMTGADVVFFVRGAYRRARRAQRAQINHADLVDEITRRPRRPDSMPRLSVTEMNQVAIHEAGHALARLLSSTKGADITFVTIVPRLDGTLGFVATLPGEGQTTTRRALLERLETALAGRAAEELVLGDEDVGAGAGGPSESSDLAVATRLATMLVCQSGLGEERSLRWAEQPTADQLPEIDRLLGDAYKRIFDSLHANRSKLDHIVAALSDQQEMSGEELRELVLGQHV